MQASASECKRVQSGSLSQSLHLINASDMRSKLADGKVKIGFEDRESPSDQFNNPRWGQKAFPAAASKHRYGPKVPRRDSATSDETHA